MKTLYKTLTTVFLTCFLLIGTYTYGHSVQVAYGVNCNGDLRIYVEHWHSTEDPNSTTMNISVNVGGVITNIVGSPNGGVQDVPIGSLPGSTIPIVSFGQGGGANTYNDWVWYDFPGVPSGVNIIVTIQSGNTVFTQGDGSGGSVGYPVSSAPFVIPPNVTPNFANQSVCGGQNTAPVVFTDPVTTTWTNSNPAIGLPASGTGNIPAFTASSSTLTQVATITIASPCYTTSFNYTIEPTPDPTFSFPPSSGNNYCRQFAVQFTLTDPSSIGTSQWTFGDGGSSSLPNPSHTYAANGTYTVKVDVTAPVGTCTSSATQTISVYTPTANFNLANNCLNLPTTFTSTSNSPEAFSSQVWDYGDASPTGMGVSPARTYVAPNTYTVKLVIKDVNLCKDSVNKPITVHPNPVISFSASPVCLNVATVFTNSSSVAPPDNIPAANWAWDFDNDGTTDNTTQSPTTTYTAPGVHTVELKATSNNNCRDSALVNIVVNANPTATFTPISACEGSTIALNNTSSIPLPDNIVSWSWDFGANSVPTTGVLPNPSTLIYTLSGIKLITLTVTANNSCTATITQTVDVFPNPIPDFAFVNTCINAQPFNFDASPSNVLTGFINSYVWSYGDATSGAGLFSNHPYAAAQLYNAKLTITSDKGCIKSITKQVEVYEKPKMIVSNSKACDTKPMTFTATALPNSGTVINWFWDFNNSISTIESNTQTSSYTFPAPGNQTLALVTETNKGCRDTMYKVVYVDYVPKPAFTVDKPSGCPLPHAVIFTDNTPQITGPGVNAIWKWIFGDGTVIYSNTNTTQNHNYTNTSTSQNALFDVKLVVKTDQGCVDSLIQTSMITVFPKPLAKYSVSPNPADVVTPLVYFTNASKDYTKWWWRFGDTPAVDSVNVNPTHYYDSETGNTYASILIVENQFGCSDTDYVQVEIGPAFAFYIPNAFTPGDEDSVNPVFTGKGIGIEKYEMWIYDRWGNSLYYTDDIVKGWDGKPLGKSDVVAQDVYVWKVKIKDVLGKLHNYVGHVTLLKNN